MHQVAVGLGAVPDRLQQRRPSVLRLAGHGRTEVLQQDRNTPERAVGKGAGRLVDRSVEPLGDHGIEMGVRGLDALDGRCDEF